MLKELNSKEREQNLTILKMKEIKLQFETELAQMNKSTKATCVDLWKKDALLARVQAENESLVSENRRLKGVNTINDSILQLPSACFVDIQSAQKQREAVHSATAQVIEDLATEKARDHPDSMM